MSLMIIGVQFYLKSFRERIAHCTSKDGVVKHDTILTAQSMN
jgi:hypothetical protein